MLGKFALFYFLDKSVEVESSDIIVKSNTPLSQVTACPDLTSEDGWIEVKWPIRKGRWKTKTHAAKILMFGDDQKVLIEKRNRFIRGEDIWTEAVGMFKRKMKRNPRYHTALSAETSIKTGIPKKATELGDSEPPFSEDGEQPRSTHRDSDSDSDVEIMRPRKKSKPCTVELDEETVQALKELPSFIKTVRQYLEKLDQSDPRSSSDTTVDEAQPSSSKLQSSDVVVLPNSTVKVSKRLFQWLNRTRMSVYAQELAVLVFGKETLAKSSITGKHSHAFKDLPEKAQLDPEKVNALIDCVIGQFPGTTVQDVKNILRRKCNIQYTHNIMVTYLNMFCSGFLCFTIMF
ncbi:uncharacterized protein LOC143489362 [Brachyhypopomus gauderio]|uniref:uncharacterized protein LOC143489362 n=1 Tax=Brachyhypopomus gauderio TaxID=698409 RepID=UPI0040421021